MLKHLLRFIAVSLFTVTIVISFAPPQWLYQTSIAVERKLAGLTLKQIAITEGNISYFEGGDGPTIVLLHGFGAQKEHWLKMAKYLRHYRLIIIDLPAFGDSFSNSEFSYDVMSQVARLKEFIEATNTTDFHLVGSSMGGYIAANYAARYSEDSKSLWLISPLGINDSPLSEMGQQIMSGRSPIVLPRNAPELRDLMNFAFVNSPYIPSSIIDYLGAVRQQQYPNHKAVFNDIHPDFINGQVSFKNSLETAFMGIKVPTLISWGNNDRILHPDGGKRLKIAYPHIQYHAIANVGHLPMIEAPQLTAKRYVSFIQINVP